MLDIEIGTIPHATQRYPTVGDYFKDEEIDVVHISDMGNRKYEFLVAVHELVEMFLCQERGIAEEDITAFDIEYEAKRPEGDFSEPGNDPTAPYYKEHQFATYVEKQLADQLGVDWEEYDKAVCSL